MGEGAIATAAEAALVEGRLSWTHRGDTVDAALVPVRDRAVIRALLGVSAVAAPMVAASVFVAGGWAATCLAPGAGAPLLLLVSLVVTGLLPGVGLAWFWFDQLARLRRRLVRGRLLRSHAARHKAVASIESITDEHDGTRVSVKGRVAGESRMRATLSADNVVGLYLECEAMVPIAIARDSRFRLQHAQVDGFDVVDAAGSRLRVDVTTAHILPGALRWRRVREAQRAQVLLAIKQHGTADDARALAAASSVRAAEATLRDGDEVTVFGIKESTVDPDAERAPREVALKGTIRGTREHPLLIVMGR